MIDKLYLIGNGFDQFTGLRSKYSDFRSWLEQYYPFIYENLYEAYDIKGDWWKEFELQLGELDIKRFVSKYAPNEKTIEEIVNEIIKEEQEKWNVIPSLYYESPCAQRLAGLLDILQYCFEKWVDNIERESYTPKYTHIEKEDSYFINFNYTDTLNRLYNIPDERILHIHGKAKNHDHLVFGHNTDPQFEIFGSQDCSQVCEVLNRYQKKPYENIYKHEELPQVIREVKKVFVYGLSFSSVDEDYYDWIVNNTPNTSQWEISWKTEEDKDRILNFLFFHATLRGRHNLVQLKECKR